MTNKTRYRFFGSLGPDTIDTADGDLMALRIARLMSGKADLQIIDRWNGTRWVQLHVTQMLYGYAGDANLKGAYGSASARAFGKAQREFDKCLV